jgi:gliding motility-associated-like protein
MKLYFHITSFFLLALNTLSAQNLIQNFDFNKVSQSFTIMGNIDAFTFWHAHYATNGEYNWFGGGAHDTSCISSSGLFNLKTCPGIHYSTPGNQNNYILPFPYSGKGFGTLIFNFNGFDSIQNVENRSLIYNELSSTLLADSIYCTEVHVQVFQGKERSVRYNYTHNGLGFYFSNNDSLASPKPWVLGIQPQISGFGYLTNTDTWRKLKGNFTAIGNEKYFFIGNFFPLTSPLQLLSGSIPSNDSASILLFDAVYVYNCRDTLFQIVQKDTTVCFGQSVNLQPQLQGFKLQDSITSYYWQTPMGNFTTATANFLATQPGSYTVQATINKRFKAATNFTVNWVPEPPDSSFLPDSLALCPGQPQLLSVPEITGATYQWSNGDTTSYSTIGQPGMYTLQITTPCWQHNEQFLAFQSNCGERVFIPNAFTPDGDGTNDFFEIFGPLQPFSLIVTDRWGKIVYQTDNYQNNWDGTSRGMALPAGVYSYRILYSKLKGGPKNYELFGTVSILR